MVLALVTILIMLVVAGFLAREGLFTACTMCVNVVLSGLIAFNFWEPLASLVEPKLDGAKAQGYEDCLALVFIFWVTLGTLRLITNKLADTEVSFHWMVQRGGGAAVGLITGYLLSGFLVCAIETLPCPERFLAFEPKVEASQSLRRYVPPDRVWLALMHRAGAVALSRTAETFDPNGSFTARYARYRRYGEDREPLPYAGELDRTPAEKPAKDRK